MEQITVYNEPGRYAGWPANYGMWAWGDEIVLVFTVGYHDTSGEFHARDRSRPFTTVQARSLDGGQTWTYGDFPGRTPGNRGLSADEHMQQEMGVGASLTGENAPTIPTAPIDFAHPDFALMCAKTGLSAGVSSFFYVSSDRCRSWQGPYPLPMFGQTGVAARTDYIVNGAHEALLFLTANKSDGREGRVFCARTTDGGQSFALVSFIGDEPGPGAFAIMPSTVRLDDGCLLTAIRCRGGDRAAREDTTWIDLYASDDDGQTWEPVARPVTFGELGHNGNPPTLDRLPDGRLCLIYGNRDTPHSICARLSSDAGVTWSDEIVLRTGGGNYDIGYPRTVVLADGTVVTGYYYNDTPGGDGPRFIEVTRWTP